MPSDQERIERLVQAGRLNDKEATEVRKALKRFDAAHAAASRDDVSGTEDDDMSLAPGSPAIDACRNDRIPADLADADNDGNTTEPQPFDVLGRPRFVDAPVADTGLGTPPLCDMGAHETQ